MRHWESTFGEIENKSSLPKQLWEQQEMRQRIISLIICKTFTMQPRAVPLRSGRGYVAFIYKNVVTNSVAYMMIQGLALIRTVILT